MIWISFKNRVVIFHVKCIFLSLFFLRLLISRIKLVFTSWAACPSSRVLEMISKRTPLYLLVGDRIARTPTEIHSSILCFVTQSMCLIFSGFILGNVPKERRNEISKDHVCGGKMLFSSIMSLCLLVSSAGRAQACRAGTMRAEFPFVFFLIG